jgi:hypothetical protein
VVTEFDGILTLNSWRDLLQRLNEACRFFGITQGRSVELRKLVIEFFDQRKRSRDHFLAVSESLEVAEIHELWAEAVVEFPGLKDRVCECLSGGPAVTEDERRGASSHRPRDHAFTYLLAGRLMRGQLPVVAVDGISRDGSTYSRPPDIVLEWRAQRTVIECKRPQLIHSVRACSKEAASQIRKTGLAGVVALDCSRLVRRLGTAFAGPSPAHVKRAMDSWLQADVLGRAAEVAFKSNAALAIILFARAPQMTITNRSAVIAPSGTPFQYARPDSVMALVLLPNDVSGAAELVEAIRRVWLKPDGPTESE